MTPAEVSAMYERKTNDDRMHWNHTSSLMWAVLAPHQKKGSQLKPEDLNPYVKKKNAVTAEDMRRKMDSPEVKRYNEKLKEQWKGKRTVWDKFKNKEK